MESRVVHGEQPLLMESGRVHGAAGWSASLSTRYALATLLVLALLVANLRSPRHRTTVVALASSSQPAAFATALQQRAQCQAAREDGFGPAVLPGNDWTGPLSVGSGPRPVKVVIAEPATPGWTLFQPPEPPLRSLVYLANWKAGSNSVLAHLQRLYGATRTRGPHRQLSPPEAEGGHRRGPLSTSLEVQRVLEGGGLAFTVVREPLARFVSGWRAWEPLPLCAASSERGAADAVASKARVACPAVVAQLEAHARNLSRSRPPSAWSQTFGYEHWLSQPYVLGATGRDGRQIRLAAVARLENLDDDMRSIAAMAGAASPSAWAAAAAKPTRALHAHPDGGEAVAAYSQALLARPAAACLLMCDVLAQEYDCLAPLGYKPAAVRCDQCAFNRT